LQYFIGKELLKAGPVWIGTRNY